MILEHSDPRRGGAEAYAHALVERLRAHGHDVSLRSRTGPWAQPVRSWPAALRPVFYSKTFLPDLRDRGAEVVLALPPVHGSDFFQPHNGMLDASIPPHLDPVPEPWQFLRRVNPVRRLHFALLRVAEADAVAGPSRVLALSPRVVDDLARAHPHARPAVMVRPGVDLERFFPADQEGRAAIRSRLGLPAGPVCVFAARNARLKGIRTARELTGVHLSVASDLPDKELPALLRCADLLVHPTYYDTAALVVMEALASGTPVITTDRDGNADLARAGGGEALAAPGDAAALQSALERLLSLDRDAQAAKARAAVEGFGAEAKLDEMVGVLCGSVS